MKGLKLSIIMILIVMIFSGCNGEKSSDPEKTENTSGVNDLPENSEGDELRFTEISVDFPVIKPRYVDEVKSLPEDMKIDSTAGSVRDITIKDGYAYYYVNYDSDLNAYCKEAGIFRQDLSSGSLEKLTDIYLEKGIFVTNLDYDDESLFWTYVLEENQEIVTGDEKPVVYIDRLINGKVVSCGKFDQSEPDEDGSWKNEVPGEYLEEDATFIGENSDVIAWNQYEYKNDYTKGVYIDIYDKKSGKVNRISANEYGDVIRPVLAGENIYFLTYRDIKSFTSENDLYDNIYAINIYTYDVQRVTDNSNGSEDSLEATLFFTVEYENGYLFVISADDSVGEDGKVIRDYNTLHYMKIQ